MAYKHIPTKEFVGPTLVSAVVCLILLLIIAGITSCVQEETRDDLKQKQTFFLALQGKETATAAEEFPKTVAAAKYVRDYLLQNTDKDWEEFLKTERLYRELYKVKPSADWRELKEKAITNDKSVAPLLELVETSAWYKLTDEERKAIPDIFTGKAEVPALNTDTPDMPSGFLLWIVLASQFICFGVYLIYWKNDWKGRGYRWYHLAWGTPWVVIVFLLLLPGALPLMVIALTFQVLATDFAELVAKKRKQNKAKSAPRTEFNFDRATRQSQELAERLKKRLAGGKE